MTQERKIFSLAALNQSLERLIRDKFAMQSYWVIAEITKSQEKNGHYYLDLADSKDGKRIAEMSATMWFTTFNRVNSELNGELTRIFKSGNKVLVNVRIEFHSIYGLKLNILNVDPTITYGEIEKQKKETIERLRKEGLLDLQMGLYLPPIIKKVALIGSPNTSGYRDFLSELTSNSIYTNFKIKEFPATVQGDRAINEIVKAILKARQYNVDVIVLVRGGGSKMDLNVFNEYEIAKTIAETKIPIITGIGHETDEVVADIVSHSPQITPTAVAKFLYQRAGIFRSELQTGFDAIIKISLGMIGQFKDEFNHTSKYLIHYTQNLLKDENNGIKELIHDLRISTNELLDNERFGLELRLNKIGNHALNIVALKKSTELNVPFDKVIVHAENLIDRSRVQVENQAELLDLLNPEELLKKGYTLSTINDVDLRQFSGEIIGAELKTLTDKKLYTSVIKSVKENN